MRLYVLCLTYSFILTLVSLKCTVLGMVVCLLIIYISELLETEAYIIVEVYNPMFLHVPVFITWF